MVVLVACLYIFVLNHVLLSADLLLSAKHLRLSDARHVYINAHLSPVKAKMVMKNDCALLMSFTSPLSFFISHLSFDR